MSPEEQAAFNKMKADFKMKLDATIVDMEPVMLRLRAKRGGSA